MTLFNPTASVAEGDRLAFGWLKASWLYLLLIPALLWGWSSLSLTRSLASVALTVFTVGLGILLGCTAA